ncbi:hypothetical protein BC834DRAFT_967609 [Gloeopeniophorella convolvens]|nr:hypothetical protein BC834DRAFT_967609 [Gloeopeniophorella convolvens]
MLFASLVLAGVLALGPQAALSAFHSISFSPIDQCGPFNISFSGGEPPAALPLTLTVVPFNSTPIAITIPASAWDDATSTGAYVTFLPLPAGETLVASLDDAAGNSVALVSDVIRIQPSSNTSCLSSNSTAIPTPYFTFDTQLAQCQQFDVSWDATGSTQRPSVRAFIPLGQSMYLKAAGSGASQAPATTSYTVDIARGSQVALLLDDGQGGQQVSDLLTVEGDTSSSGACLEGDSKESHATTGGISAPSNSGLSRPVIIAIVAGISTAVFGVLVLALIFVRRERRRRTARFAEALEAGLQSGGQHDGSHAPAPSESARTRPEMPRSRVLADPPYPTEQFMTPSLRSPVSLSSRSSIFTPFVPSVSGSNRQSRTTASIRSKSTVTEPRVRSITDLDIASMLEMASSAQSEPGTLRGYQYTSPSLLAAALASTSPAPALIPPPPSAVVRPLGQKRSQQELDVPSSPLGRLSEVSLDSRRRPSIPILDTVVIEPVNAARSQRRASPNSLRDTDGRPWSNAPL